MPKFSLLVLVVLSTCSTIAFAQPVFPTTVKNLKMYELGNAILLFMPDKNQNKVDWSYRANSPIYWIDDNYSAVTKNDGAIQYLRSGLMRINVKGNVSTFLKKQQHELAWTVTYKSVGLPKFGVESIELNPGTPESVCFGTDFDGCSFDPQASLNSSKISFTKLCEKKEYDDFEIAYQLSHPNKKKVFGVWSHGGGSGGVWSSFKIVLSDSQSTLCKAIEAS